MRMKQLKSQILVIIGVLLLSHTSSAVMISLEPSLTLAMPGDTVSLNLTISDLGNGGAPSVGEFDINLNYDDSALSLLGVSFGNLLGDAGNFEALTQTIMGAGTLRLIELSFLSVLDLNALQSDSFVLATLDFMVDVLDLGNSTMVDFGSVLVGDAFGQALTLDNANAATISNPDPMQVAEPSALLLIGVGVLAFGLAVRQRRRS